MQIRCWSQRVPNDVASGYNYFMVWGKLVVVKATTGGFFHMSVAKNTAHAVAVSLECLLRSSIAVGGSAPFMLPPPARSAKHHVIINLDCDNIMGTKFLSTVVKRFLDGFQVVQYKGFESATTGRISATEEAFVSLNGYDEEGTYGSGSQDIDFLQRANKSQFGTICKVKVRGGEKECHEAVGFALPNALQGGPKVDRDTSKIVNCYNPDKLKWTQMNERNWQIMSARTSAGHLQRN